MPACWRSARWHDEPAARRDRDICLIPSSAHGTNPASAVMAGMQVVVVGCDAKGNVDLADLEAKADAARGPARRADGHLPQSPTACSRTAIKDICAIVHEHGGQVYMDGANINALVGLARPAELGADVCHINLHKTFCIPHGGGGPGMGPIGVKAHLAPFLPATPSSPARTRRRASRRRLGRPLGLRLDPADLLGLHRA